MKKRFVILIILFLFLFGAKNVLASTPTISSITPQNIAKGDIVTISGSDLAYTDITNSKVCFNDVNTSCDLASNAITWNNSEIKITPTAITDYSGWVFVFIDGVKYKGPFYYLKPVIKDITLDGNYIIISGERSYYYDTFNPFSSSQGAIIVNGQELPAEANFSGTNIKALLPDNLRNLGNTGIKVKYSNGIESDSKEYFISTCSADVWDCSDWGACSSNGQQTRVCNKTFDCLAVNTLSPLNTQICSYTPPTCTAWEYSGWSSCLSSGGKTRSILSSSPSGCSGGHPALSESCTYVPSCTSSDWSCTNWGACSSGGIQARTCRKTSNCEGGVASPIVSQDCSYVLSCTSGDWSCSDWGSCSSNNMKSRTCSKTSNCEGGVASPTITESCSYISQCTSSNWSCSDWGSCSSNNMKSRTCSKTSNCEGGIASPTITQSCTYTPACSEDIWSCGNWGTCSPQGIQTRSCNRTFDCSSAETAAPDVFQYCEPPTTKTNQTNSNKIDNDLIIKATVQLLCYDSRGIIGAGSGTIIDSRGIILTNKHVIEKDTQGNNVNGCFVGSTSDITNYPDFSETAYILSKATNQDVAILKINSNKTNYSYINVGLGSSDNLIFGKKIFAYGYPVYNKSPKSAEELIQKITYSSGDFSGYDSYGYFKTTAMLEHGISGGGAYSEDGVFVGITSGGLEGSANTMGLVLGINNIKSWISSSGVSTGYNKSMSGYLAPYVFSKMGVNYFDVPEDSTSSNEKTVNQTAQNNTTSTSSLADVSNVNELLSSLGKSRNVSEEEKYDKLLKSDVAVYKIEQSDEQKIAVTNFVTYGMSSGTIQLGAGERRALVRDYFETVGRGDITWSDMENLVNGKKVVARNLAKENQQVTAVLKVFKKIFGHVPVFSDPKEDLSWNTMMYRIRFPRDLEKEKAGISKFQKIFYYSPKTPLDWAAVRALGYIN